MEFVIELLLDLILEGSIELSSNKKVPKWIRYPLIGLIVLFFSGIIIGLLILGLVTLKKMIFVGLLLIILSIIFIVFGISKFKKLYLERKDN